MTSQKKTKRTKKPKYLSTYEEDLIWMSYRYCIGRHTIAANMHAGNIAKHAYGKLSPMRQQFMAFDIRRSIEDDLRISQLNFYIAPYIQNQDNPEYRPLEMFLDALKANGIKDRTGLTRVGRIDAEYNRETGQTEYKVKYIDDDKESIPESLIPDCHDLLVWADLAACFDKRNHKMISYLNKETNEIVKYEAFESYVLTSYNTYEFRKIWRPVESYINNPFITTWLDEAYIKKIEDMPIDEEI